MNVEASTEEYLTRIAVLHKELGIRANYEQRGPETPETKIQKLKH